MGKIKAILHRVFGHWEKWTYTNERADDWTFWLLITCRLCDKVERRKVL